MSEKENHKISSSKLHDEVIKSLENEDSNTDHAAASSKQKLTEKDIPISRDAPKSSSFNKCVNMLRFLWTAPGQLISSP